MNARTQRLLLLHALHLLVPATLFFFDAPWLASAGLFLGAFALFHDTAHANLGLPRSMNEATLTITGALLGISGHAGRRSHLFHHAHPGAADDMEGRDVDAPLWLALLRAPATLFVLLSKSWRSAEWLLVLVVVLLAPRQYVLVMLLGQATMPLWAARLSHRPPAWLLRIAEPMARAGITVATLFVTHEAHHARPWLPTFELRVGERAQEM
ncbi:MAG: fatty acid desaturase [Archangium gephyra]|uniref:Fatty acid desaturase n=1 Tax=Archangium gephyra TaxID=48 RepID=A0A2W5TMF9_9BACT|nr:MAG: fatty acid desaturase [Archangium gephyra]